MQAAGHRAGGVPHLTHHAPVDLGQGGYVKPTIQVPDVLGPPDVYVNGEDGTVTIDPLKNQHWVRDDTYGGRHRASVMRGAAKSHNGVMEVQRIIDEKGRVGQRPTFIPTSSMLDGAHKFSSRCVANSTRGKCVQGDGQLPIHSELIWENKLSDKVDWRVEKEMWRESTHGDRTRFFDYTGICR